jgi:hypothetical protein
MTLFFTSKTAAIYSVIGELFCSVPTTEGAHYTQLIEACNSYLKFLLNSLISTYTQLRPDTALGQYNHGKTASISALISMSSFY